MDYKKERKKQLKKEWDKANIKKVLVYNEKWRKANPEKSAQYRHNYYMKNKAKLKIKQDQWNEQHLHKVRAYKALWRKKNKGKVNSWTAKRYTSKLSRTPKWLTLLHFQQIEIFYDAANRLTEELGIRFSVEHIVPLQGKNVSGLHVPWNLQVIPLLDNCIKNDTF